MTYGEEEEEEEGTVLYRLHLLQNGVSSPSSIPRLISLNNLPFSSCPNRESQNLRESEGERAKKVTRSLTLTLSFSVCRFGDRVIKPGEKKKKQRAVCRSEEVVAGRECSKIQRDSKRGKEQRGKQLKTFNPAMCFSLILNIHTLNFISQIKIVLLTPFV